jgi:hypothetical protein
MGGKMSILNEKDGFNRSANFKFFSQRERN